MIGAQLETSCDFHRSAAMVAAAGKRAIAKAEKAAAVVAESFAMITAAAEEEELRYVMDYMRKIRHVMYR